MERHLHLAIPTQLKNIGLKKCQRQSPGQRGRTEEFLVEQRCCDCIHTVDCNEADKVECNQADNNSELKSNWYTHT
eukprot:7544210-Ditylum_brightwellii.AAC.1